MPDPNALTHLTNMCFDFCATIKFDLFNTAVISYIKENSSPSTSIQSQIDKPIMFNARSQGFTPIIHIRALIFEAT